MKATILLGVLFIASQGFALPKYMKAFSATYSNFKATSCAVCHTPEDNKLNPYGVDVQKSMNGGAPNFKSIEALDSDSDNFTNIEEINAGSNPGDKDSTPNRP